MFTLKLYRRHPKAGAIQSKIIAVHSVVTNQIGKECRGLEITGFVSDQNNDYITHYVGEPEEGMTAFGRDDNHLHSGDGSWWGWGLLENWEGNTSEHYRPANYG
jgi:hypothetical protein